MKKILLKTFSTAVILLALLVGLRILYGYTSAYTLWSTIMPTPGATVPLQYGLTTTGTIQANVLTSTTTLSAGGGAYSVDSIGNLNCSTLRGNSITTSGSGTFGSVSSSGSGTFGSVTIGSHTPWTIGSCTLAYNSVTNSNAISVQCPANNKAIMGSVSCNPVNIVQSCPSSFSSGCTLSAGFSNSYWNGVCAAAPANAYVWALCCPN